MKIRFDRLKKLANHLIKSKLGHKKFDFAVINAESRSQPNAVAYECGKLGCALGELPILFPELVKFTAHGNIRFKNINEYEGFRDASIFFNITCMSMKHLFIPTCQQTKVFKGRKLGKNSTAKQVGKHLIAFIKLLTKLKITTLKQLVNYENEMLG
jgi:hypothetical protein